MIDQITGDPLRVDTTGGKELTYLVVPERQLAQVRALLDAHRIGYEVDEFAISRDGGPEYTFIDLDRGTDPALVQRLLDGVP